jgi:hypothetical protein
MPAALMGGEQLSRRRNAMVKLRVFNDLRHRRRAIADRRIAAARVPASRETVRKPRLFVILSIDSTPTARNGPHPWSSSPKKPCR